VLVAAIHGCPLVSLTKAKKKFQRRNYLTFPIFGPIFAPQKQKAI
jgi:hypothetical protein